MIPTPDKQVFYRHVTTGDRGYLVTKDGRDMIRLDRPQEEILRKFSPMDWVPDRESRPCTKAQVAQIAMEAHAAAAFFLGNRPESKREWLSMDDGERLQWIDYGPPDTFPDIYKRLWSAIHIAFEDYSK